MRAEDALQCAVCKYISFAYPGVIFTSDASGIVTSIGQATKMKRMRSQDAIPDLLIFEARSGYHGLLLELKARTPYLKDGVTLKKDAHLADQQKTLDKLTSRGYKAVFSTGFDESKKIIDSYMNGKG
jgi:hypothetical protein